MNKKNNKNNFIFTFSKKIWRNKYFEKCNFYYKKNINKIVYNNIDSINILYKDLNIYDEFGEILRRYYTKEESEVRMNNYVESYTEIEYELLPNPSKFKLSKIILKREFKLYKIKNRIYKEKDKNKKKKNLKFNIIDKLKNSEYLVDYEISSLLLRKKLKQKNLSNNINKEISDQLFSYSNSIHNIYDPEILKKSFINSSISNDDTFNNSFLWNVSNITLRYKKQNSKYLIKNFLNSELESVKEEFNIKLKKKPKKNCNNKNINKESNTIFKTNNNKNLFKKKKVFNLDLKNTNSNVSYDKIDNKIVLNLKNKKSNKMNKKDKKYSKDKNKLKLKNKLIFDNNLNNLKTKSSKYSVKSKKFNTERKTIANKLLKNNSNKNIFYNGTTPQNNMKGLKKIPKLIDFYLKSFTNKNIDKIKIINTPQTFNKLFNSKKSFSFKNINQKLIKIKKPKIKNNNNKINKKIENLIISNSLPNFKKTKKIKKIKRK